jgi:hypothetical protein
MIEKAQRRLRQARFFYQHLVNEGQQASFRHDLEAFEFYFSAFIQAARSVTWTLGNEEPDKWKAWEPTWKANRSIEEQRLLDLTNELRRDEVHRGGADLTVDFEEIAINELLSAASLDPWRQQHPDHRPQMFSPLGMSQAKRLRRVHYFEDREGKEEISAICGRYLELLEKVVRDFCSDMKAG